MSNDYINKTYHRILLEEKLKKYAPLVRGKILDVGSKNRRYDSCFKGNITAIDIVPNEKLNVVFGNIEKEVAFADNSFGGITCIEVFEYLDNYKNAAQEICRLLKPGGVALVTIPFMYHDHNDKIRFTKDFIIKQFVGMSSVECEKIGNAYIVGWDILRKKVLKVKNKFLKRLLFLLILPVLAMIKILRLQNKQDEFYSGLFLIVRK